LIRIKTLINFLIASFKIPVLCIFYKGWTFFPHGTFFSSLFVFRLLSFFLGADNTKTSLFLVVPSLHHPSFTKKNITTHARAIHSNAIHFRALYIYIYTHKKTFNASSFVFVGWSFVLLKETHRRSERRRKKSSTATTENTQRRLFVFVLNLRALISSRARVSLSLSRCSFERRRGGKEEEAQRGTENDTETTVRKKKTKKTRGKEERETTTSSSPLSRRATLGTKNCRFIFHLGFSN